MKFWLLGIAVFLTLIFLPEPSYAWLSGWQYRRNITVNNTQNSNALSDYQVAINLTYDSNMQPDFSDIRFTNSTDYQLPYWVESKVNSTWAYVWVKVPYVPASGYTTIYVYYGNTTPVSSASNASSAFIREIDGVMPLRASWHLDENSGNTVGDSSGNSNNGNKSGATWTGTSVYGYALSFDGNDYVDFGSPSSLNAVSGMSVSAWVRANSLAGSGQFNYVVAKEQSDWVWILRYDGSLSKYSFYVKASTDCGASASMSFSTSVWYHLVGTYDGSSIKIYVNGTEKGSSGCSGTIAQSSDKVTMGASYWTSSWQRYFNGVIDEVMIFNRSLTQNEITDIYNYYSYASVNYPSRLLIRKYSSTEPTSTVGEEESSGEGVEVNLIYIAHPMNASYEMKGDDYPLHFSVHGTGASYSAIAYMDDIEVYDDIVPNGVLINITVPFYLYLGQHNLTIRAYNDSSSLVNSTLFTLENRAPTPVITNVTTDDWDNFVQPYSYVSLGSYIPPPYYNPDYDYRTQMWSYYYNLTYPNGTEATICSGNFTRTEGNTMCPITYPIYGEYVLEWYVADNDAEDEKSNVATKYITVHNYEYADASYPSSVIESDIQNISLVFRINPYFVNYIQNIEFIYKGAPNSITQSYEKNTTHLTVKMQHANITASSLSGNVNFNGTFTVKYYNFPDENYTWSGGSQTVYMIVLSPCNATFDTDTLDITVLDEDSGEVVDNVTSSSILTAWRQVPSINRTYVINETSFCIYPSWAVYNSTINTILTKDGYAPAEYYPYTITVLSNESQQITVKMLQSTYAYPIVFTLPGERYAIVVEKRKPDLNYEFIRSTSSDFNNNAVVFLRMYDTYYRITIFTDNMESCFVSGAFKIATTQYEVSGCTEVYDIELPTTAYTQNVNMTCVFDDMTSRLRCDYYAIDGLDHNVTLTIYKYVGLFGKQEYYSASHYAVSGGFDVELESGYTYEYAVTAHSFFGYIRGVIDLIERSVDSTGVFFILILSVAALVGGVFNIITGIAIMIFSVMIMIVLGVVPPTAATSVAVSFAILAGIFIFVMRRNA